MSSVSQSVKYLRELVASSSRRKRRRRRQTRLTYPLAGRAAFLAVEPLEPRLLLSTTQPFDPVNNLNGYMDLGGDLRFMLESDGAAWTQGASSAIWHFARRARKIVSVTNRGGSRSRRNCWITEGSGIKSFWSAPSGIFSSGPRKTGRP